MEPVFVKAFGGINIEVKTIYREPYLRYFWVFHGFVVEAFGGIRIEAKTVFLEPYLRYS